MTIYLTGNTNAH